MCGVGCFVRTTRVGGVVPVGFFVGVGCVLVGGWVCVFWSGGSALLKLGAQVDVDGALQRHSTLCSWACGENVCGLAFFQW
jgi:hypothetical protein